MDKNEILEKSRKEYGIVDEREKQESIHAASVGMWVMFTLAVVYSLVKHFAFGLDGDDFMAVAFVGASATFFAHFYRLRERRYLASAIVFLVGAAIFAVSYVFGLQGIGF